MNNKKMISHRLANWLQTLLWLSGMLVLLAVLGLALAGVRGLVWATVAGAFFLYMTQRIPTRYFIRMFGGRPLRVADAPGLYRVVSQLAQRAELPAVPNLYILPSRIANALTVGKRGDAAIGITEPMLRNFNSREVVAILAHEISHIRNNDMQVMGLASVIGRVTGLFAVFGQLLLFFNLPLILMGRSPISWLVILVLLAAPTLSSLLQFALSRTREFDADLGAVRLTGDPQGLASALGKLETYQTSLLRRMLWPGSSRSESSLFRTHPKTSERIKRLFEVSDANLSQEPIDLSPSITVPVRRPPLTYRRPGWFILG